MKIPFLNDYNHTAHPAILDALAEIRDNAYIGYGLDTLCEEAKEDIKKYLDNEDSEVHFLVGGTQTNLVMINAALKPYQSVLSADTGHINRHETGAIEHGGHKVETLPMTDGKITAKQVDDYLEEIMEAEGNEHITIPGMLYISSPTEYGTLYSEKELADISAVCKKHGIYFYLDGARLAYALGTPQNDVSLADLAHLTDAFYIGGNKCGAMMGEALVINNKELQPHFRNFIKQNGAMLEKGWLLGLQFHTFFKDGLYLSLGKEVIEMAMDIKKAFLDKGIRPYIDSPTNQQFFCLTQEQLAKLEEKYIPEIEGKDGDMLVVRFCTSWSTKPEDVAALVEDIKAL